MSQRPLTPPPATAAREFVEYLARGVLGNRPTWIGTCRWCLGSIYRPTPTSGWHHIHGSTLCRHPLTNTPPDAYPTPLDVNNPVADLRRTAHVVECARRWPPGNHHPTDQTKPNQRDRSGRTAPSSADIRPTTSTLDSHPHA